MIVVKLMGGLGNQLFQYAAGRCLSYLHKTELKLDLSFLNAPANDAYTKREFALNVYKAPMPIASEAEVAKFTRPKGAVMSTLQRKLPILFSSVTVNESGNSFHKEFFSYPANVYLNGFWQSEKYFLQIREVLLSELQLKDPLSEGNKALASEISGSNAVSLHIRRGDYVSNKNALEFHGICSLSYYQNAIEYVKHHKGEIKLFVFSDDLKWAQENFTQSNVVFVSGNPAHVDLYLMSLCKHNIIANSSFSWWGAWLNANKEKMVVAPKNWFAKPEMNSPDIYPPGWMLM